MICAGKRLKIPLMNQVREMFTPKIADVLASTALQVPGRGRRKRMRRLHKRAVVAGVTTVLFLGTLMFALKFVE